MSMHHRKEVKLSNSLNFSNFELLILIYDIT